MGLLDKVKETAQKGADNAKEGGQGGPGEARRAEAQEEDQRPQGRARRRSCTRRRPARPGRGVDAEVEIARIVAEINAVEAEIAEAASDDAAADRRRRGVEPRLERRQGRARRDEVVARARRSPSTT